MFRVVLEVYFWEEMVGFWCCILFVELCVCLEWCYGVSVVLCGDCIIICGFGVYFVYVVCYLMVFLVGFWD